ncbi:MAG: 50S ribosomal protein L6 [Candidatus Desantisbacteria bacterium]
MFMSRIGKKPISILDGVKAKVEDGKIEVSGPRGTLFQSLLPKIGVEIGGSTITVQRSAEDKLSRSLHGLFRSLINNMVIGVSQGYEKVLILTGVGWRAQMKGKDLELNVGYSHPVIFSPPEGIAISTEKEKIKIAGIDKQLVGETSAQIREIRKVEPYKGKGLRYSDEHVRRKVGKAGAK